MGIGIATLLNLVEAYATMLGVTAGRLPLPLWHWLPPMTETSLLALIAVTMPATIALTAGLWVRSAASCIVLSTGFMFVWEQQTYSNHMTLCAWLCLWLAFSRSDATWSLAARLNGQGVVRFGDQVLLMTQLSICYFFAAVVKLNGQFLEGDYLDSITWPDLPIGVFVAMSFGTVAAELFLAAGLWFAKTRRLAAATGLGLHLSIPVMMPNWYPLVSFSLVCLSLYALFFVHPMARDDSLSRTPSHTVATDLARHTLSGENAGNRV
jgi:hypothetical protein